MKKIFTIGVLLVIISILLGFSGLNFFRNQTAYAVGDLTVNWGVPSGKPIFTVNNMLPGDTQTRTVSVTNGALTPRKIAVRAIKTSETNNFANILDIVIANGNSDIYGGNAGSKTLAQFFADSSDPMGIPLSTLNAGQSTNYTVKVSLDASVGNESQGSSVIFDLKILISFALPEECLGIEFNGNPIFGTQGNDELTGTSGNDIILGLEGNDRIRGVNGNDCIIGGLGNDGINGGDGNDKIFGSEGNDEIGGSNGDDQIFGGSGNDAIAGGNGNDQLFGEGGNDNINGGPGVDIANGGLGNDSCTAETETNCEL